VNRFSEMLHFAKVLRIFNVSSGIGDGFDGWGEK